MYTPAQVESSPGQTRGNQNGLEQYPIVQQGCWFVANRVAKQFARAGDGDKQNLCGITGFTHRDGVLDPARLRIATDSLIHRGPDQQGTYESEQISLGAVRLK